MRDKIPHGIEVHHVALPTEVAAEVAKVRKAAADEMVPVLDEPEQRIAGTDEG